MNNIVSRIIDLFHYLSTKESYAIGYRVNNSGNFDLKDSKPFMLIMPTQKEWYADPFLYKFGGVLSLC